MPGSKGYRSPRNVETRKKKARRKIPRAAVSRPQGNTPAVRKRLKKMAGKARATAAMIKETIADAAKV